MDTFYKKWLKENEKANKDARQDNSDLLENIQNPEAASTPTTTPTTAIPSTSRSNVSPIPSTSRSNVSPIPLPSVSENLAPKNMSEIIYENDLMKLTIEKSSFLRQKKFKLHDHLFHIKITLKNSNRSPPLLRDILNFLQIAFDHILTNIRTLYNNDDHNVAFLTLYQKPMVNGLNTGGFDLQENSVEMVQRLLTMLEQFLVSNQNLKLDESFKVYLKVLSVQHMQHKQKKPLKKRGKAPTTKKVGSRVKPTKNYNYFWALDVPNSFENAPNINVFKDKCLLTGTILGLLQNQYFKSLRKNKDFLYIQYINSVNKPKQNRAGKILLRELNKLISCCNLEAEGPHDLEETAKKLSEIYKCQFFIFDSVYNSSKLQYMYPSVYDDSLIPIYLFQPHDAKTHLVFIRNVKSFFKARVTVCFGCKKTFNSYNYRHLCPKRPCCFSCRRFFQTKDTYLHEKLLQDFCDKNITKEEMFTCSICNVTCYSKHCLKGHRRICNGQGTFGYKCLMCNKFTYRYSNQNGKILKEKHQCNNLKNCKFCREPQELNHLCKLKLEESKQIWPQLAFLTMEYFDNSSENCLECHNVRETKEATLFCPSHQIKTESDDEPILTIIYREETKKGSFTKYQFENFETVKLTKSEESLLFNYDELITNDNSSRNSKTLNKSEELKANLQKLNEKEITLMTDKILQLIMTWENTTFICQDEDSTCYVRFNDLFLVNYSFFNITLLILSFITQLIDSFVVLITCVYSLFHKVNYLRMQFEPKVRIFITQLIVS